MKKKVIRGQGGLEYLMTYGWAIMVVMALAIALWRLGVLSSQPATSYIGFSKLKPQVQGTTLLKTTGEFAGTFLNSFGLPITNLTVSHVHNKFDGKDCENIVLSKTVVAKDEHFSITANNCNAVTHHYNEIYEIEIKLTYDIGMGVGVTASGSDSGAIRGPYE